MTRSPTAAMGGIDDAHHEQKSSRTDPGKLTPRRAQPLLAIAPRPEVTGRKEDNMALRGFIIERDIPQVGTFEREQLRAASAKSNEVLRQLGPDIQWIESYVADDKTFCVYLAQTSASSASLPRLAVSLPPASPRSEP